MSLLAEYFKEAQTKEIVEDDRGFATYYFLNEGVYVEDIWIKPEFRSNGAARDLLDQIAEIAKNRGCSKMLGSCVPSAKNSTHALKAAFSYGFELLYAKENFIAYSKDLV